MADLRRPHSRRPRIRQVQQARAESEEDVPVFYPDEVTQIDYGNGDIEYEYLGSGVPSQDPIPLISESFSVEERTKKEERAKIEAQHPKSTQVCL